MMAAADPHEADDHETAVKSYRYLRTAMVIVLIWLAAAVIYQSCQQGFIRSSISAYYYTPAQAAFVGALIALGVCMIALQGTTPAEDILLNIGGMFAPIVALVPTARDKDTLEVLRRCQEISEPIFGDQGTPIDCAAIKAQDTLAAVVKTNIVNNVTALFIAGLVGLAATYIFYCLDKKPIPNFKRYFVFAIGLYVVGAVVFFFGPTQDLFVRHAHLFAAVGLFACIFSVAVVNALRHQKERLSDRRGFGTKARRLLSVLFLSGDRYAVVGAAMLVVIVAGLLAVRFDLIPDALFWLEATLIVLFALFWGIQTKERWHDDHPPASQAELSKVPARP